jgi:trimethyllysine dioxygenase
VLKQFFGSVFVHPRRGADKTFNVASHHASDAARGTGLPNYDVNRVLLPHNDHSHYTHPARVQGLYMLEGSSVNTFVSCPAAYRTMQAEVPHLTQYLRETPIALGRVAEYYEPPMYQATVDSALTPAVGDPDRIHRFRWHPHLSGSLLAPFEKFQEARQAHRVFQEIMRRDTHQVKLEMRPGDLYIWDNFRVLHGREFVTEVPRTAVGQTVPEQVILDRWREVLVRRLSQVMSSKWLIHVPLERLDKMAEEVQEK